MDNEAFIRTEDLSNDEIEKLYVESLSDRENIEALKSNQQLLLVGSRGTGKTMLMKKAEIEMDNNFKSKRIIPIYVNFSACTIYKDVNMTKLMLSRVLNSLQLKLKSHGIIVKGSIFRPISVKDQSEIVKKLDLYINSIMYDLDIEDEDRSPSIDNLNIQSDIDFFKDFISELCEEYKLKKIILLFDEACQVFIPSQQRKFFDFFRALRAPNIVCKAAVYPGLVSYGTFQKFHDSSIKYVEKNILSENYLIQMRTIVKNNYPNIYDKIILHGDILDTIIYCSNGNPRFLLKSLNEVIDGNNVIKATKANEVIKEFYKTTIWSEHTLLEDKYKGHRNLIEWGRSFIENVVSKDIEEINSKVSDEGSNKATVFFAISRRAPETVKQSIKILEYSGIVNLVTEGTSFRYKLYDRYQLNFGIVLLAEKQVNPIQKLHKIVSNVSLGKFPNYGDSSIAYKGAEKLENIQEFEGELNQMINQVISKPIDTLDLSKAIKDRLRSNGIYIIKDIFEKEESDLQKIRYIGIYRSRLIYNLVMAAVLEYISG